MVSTRSASGLSAASNAKRKAVSDSSPPKSKQKKVRVAAELPSMTGPPNTVALHNGTDTTPLVPATLSFDFEEARQHLINADPRFEDIFATMQCKPFEQLEQVHPFRALVTSILGQQISWIAARSINHKFIRLFDQSIPENYADYAENKSATSFFPSPQQVVATDLATLRTAGLSGRKAEYIHDLAARFADGRLSTEKLLQATDEELSEMLIDIYGIGKWTVDMFSIFSMRRPDILPVADLGVQRGVLRWFLSLYSPTYSVTVSPNKTEKKKIEAEATYESIGKGKVKVDGDALPTFGPASGTHPEGAADTSSIPPGPVPISMLKGSGATEEDVGMQAEHPSMPIPFTPSINKTLNAVKKGSNLPPLPEGLTVSILKSRLDRKKKVKGAILTPKEMEDLTEPWRPYRSLAVFYMWALQEEK